MEREAKRTLTKDNLPQLIVEGMRLKTLAVNSSFEKATTSATLMLSLTWLCLKLICLSMTSGNPTSQELELSIKATSEEAEVDSQSLETRAFPCSLLAAGTAQ